MVQLKGKLQNLSLEQLLARYNELGQKQIDTETLASNDAVKEELQGIRAEIKRRQSKDPGLLNRDPFAQSLLNETLLNILNSADDELADRPKRFYLQDTTSSSAKDGAKGFFLENTTYYNSAKEGAESADLNDPKVRTKTLRNRLQAVDEKLRFLQEQFPDWRAWGGGYGPGNNPPNYYLEIRQLENEREALILALSKRRKPGRLTEREKEQKLSLDGKFTKAAASKTREVFLKPLLKTKGLSIRGWARNAKLDFHTADNYLKGKTRRPNPDTFKQLADALGVKVEELPE